MIRPWYFAIELDKENKQIPLYKQIAQKIQVQIMSGGLNPVMLYRQSSIGNRTWCEPKECCQCNGFVDLVRLVSQQRTIRVICGYSCIP